MNEGFDTTRDFLGNAADRAKDLGEKGVLRYEIGRLEKETEKKFAQLGNRIYKAFVEEELKTVSMESTDIATLLKEIGALEKRIEEKEEMLKQIP